MRKKIALLTVFFICTFVIRYCLAANMLDWDNDQAYRPNPILFVHGINSNSQSWIGTVPNLEEKFNTYYPVNYNFTDFSQANNPRSPYLQSFDWGGATGEQTFSGVKMNTMDEDRDSGDPRLTLQEAIRLVYQAYGQKDVVLVAHSMGGLLARYYLYKTQTNHHVRRLITLGTPHHGSPFANVMMMLNDGGFVKRTIAKMMRPIFSIRYMGVAISGKLISSLGVSMGDLLWNFYNYGKSQGLKDIMVDSGDTGYSGKVAPNPFLAGENGINRKTYPENVEYIHTPFKRKWLGNVKALDILIVDLSAFQAKLMECRKGDGIVSLYSQIGWDVY